MSAFESDVELTDVAVRDTNVSSAVDEPIRATILDMLADEEMTVEEIHDTLQGLGFDRTVNTVRHHVNELRDADLVEVARMEERRGGTLKFYRANTIVLSYSIPADDRDAVDEMAAELAPELEPILDQLLESRGEEIRDIASRMAPCEHCREQKYETYILLTILRRAFVRAHSRA